MNTKPFRVRLKDSTPESLEKRVKEKLNAGYDLHTPPITPVPTSHKLYSFKSSFGRQRSVSAGDRIITSYYAVVEKV
jgi:Domain of unknown function (DUF1737)